MNPLRIVTFVACAGFALAGCSAAPDDAPGDDPGAQTQELLGRANLTNCTQTQQSFILDSMRRGRVIATSPAFEACIRAVMARSTLLPGDPNLARLTPATVGPYNVCGGDPTPADRVGAVVEHTRSALGVAITCSSTSSGSASAFVTTTPGANETLTYNTDSLAGSIASNDQNYVAATIWHEAMHQHGYRHSGDGRAEGCGYASTTFADNDAAWMRRHTVPYLVTACMAYLGDVSDACRASLTCPLGQIAVRSAFSATAPCECRRDPQAKMATNVSPAVATTPDGALFFATDPEGRVYQNRVVLGQASQGWIELQGGARTTRAPAAALAGNAPYAFVAIRGNDGNVWLNQGDLGRSYVGWQRDATISTYVAPAVARMPDGVMLFATDTQGRILRNRVVLGQAARGWRELEGGGRTTTAPAAAIAGNAPYMFVAVRGGDGFVYINQGGLDGPFVGWQSDRAIRTNVAPSVATTPDGVIFFATDLSGRIFSNRVVLGQAGQGWREVGGGERTDAATGVALTGNAPYVFLAAKGFDNNFYINQASLSGAWVGWLQN